MPLVSKYTDRGIARLDASKAKRVKALLEGVQGAFEALANQNYEPPGQLLGLHCNVRVDRSTASSLNGK